MVDVQGHLVAALRTLDRERPHAVLAHFREAHRLDRGSSLSKSDAMFAHHRRVAAMKTTLLSSAAIAGAIATTAAWDTAHAASRFDGSWTVQIMTRRGACNPSSSFGVEIHDGVVSGPASGRVSNSGAVRVSVSSGGSYASGSGRLSTSSGSGSWRGVGSRGACSGTWVAGRR